jgi:[acyl-carrier-protein] S-malonyltransferase
MEKTVLLFPGQASQYVGMGKDLYEASSEVRRLYELAGSAIGENIAELSFNGPSELLRRTRFTQPAILLHSLALLVVLKEQGQTVAFDFAAGHSLGEYGALAACGAMTFDDAIRAVVRRAALMDKACEENPGTMAAIMGLTSEQVDEVCAESRAAGVVVPANYNSDSQIVVSGSLAGVEKAVETAKAKGAKRAILLEVGGAFHSPLMESARTGLEEFLAGMAIANPNHPVIANVTAAPEADSSRIRSLLVEQITAPVRWSQTMDYLNSAGVSRSIEVGPGKVLSGLAKRALAAPEILNLDTLENVRGFAVL